MAKKKKVTKSGRKPKPKTLQQIKRKVKEADEDKKDVIQTALEMKPEDRQNLKIWIPLIIGIIVLMLGVLEKIVLLMIAGLAISAIGAYKLITE
jgi:hypothetical protein